MANIKWNGLTSQGTVLNTQMDTVASGAFSTLGSAYDNTSKLDRWGWVELSLGSFTATAGACIYVYLVPSIDNGTDYDDGPSSTNPAAHLLVANLQVKTGASAKKLVSLVPFPLPPGLFKFAIKNQTGGTLVGSGGNTMVLYTSNEAVG
jgi:hypothetical protein